MQLADNEANKKFVAKMQSALTEENINANRSSPGVNSATFLRSGTLKNKSSLSMKGVEVLENMDLKGTFDPRDGVSLYEWTGGFEDKSGKAKSRSRGNSTLKYSLCKKGKPYTKLGKDNKTLRLTRDKYFEIIDN